MMDESARDILVDQLNRWGIAELTNDLDDLIKQGLDAPAITLQLASTQAYKDRFKANEQRRQRGLPVLSPAEYVAAEQSYQTVLRTHGLPTSFYDDREDYHQFLANDVSPDELNDRAGIAQSVWLSSDDATKTAWRSFYGLTDGAAIASILDPEKALPIVQRMANAARFGGAAVRQGLDADQGRLEQYADQGIQQGAIEEAFGKIALTKDADAKIGERFGQTLTQADREAEQIQGNASAARKRDQLYANETALFQGKAAADQGAMQRTRSGSF